MQKLKRFLDGNIKIFIMVYLFYIMLLISILYFFLGTKVLMKNENVFFKKKEKMTKAEISIKKKMHFYFSMWFIFMLVATVLWVMS